MVEGHKPCRDGERSRLKAALRTNIVLFLSIIGVLAMVMGAHGASANPKGTQQVATTDQGDIAASAGTIVSEGVHLIGADQLHLHGITGKGVKIGIIDLGFAKLDQAIHHGELPKNIIAWNVSGSPPVCRRVTPGELSAASPFAHGTAVAEIIHDVAPDAELHLYLISTIVSRTWSSGAESHGRGRADNQSLCWVVQYQLLRWNRVRG